MIDQVQGQAALRGGLTRIYRIGVQMNKTKAKIVAAVAVVSFLVLAVSVGMVIHITASAAKEQKAFDELIEIVGQTEIPDLPPAEEGAADADHSARSVLPEYAALYEQNSDLFAWLCIDGTNINYPVMHTPDDPQYYLKRAFDGSRSYSGTPFLDGKCTEDGGIYIVYGHHMSDGTMFGKLADYANEGYWKKHPTIRFDTIRERGEYEVMAAFFSKVYRSSEDGFRYYAETDLTDKAAFDRYVGQVADAALYDTGVTAEFGDPLLVLSTCHYHVDDGRFVVVARKKQEG